MSDEQQRGQQAPIQLSTEEARAGATPHVTRHVLGWGLALVIFAFAAILLFYMLRT